MVVRKGSVSEKLCAICHAKLAGMPNNRRDFKKLSKTEKRPERRFAGVLCGNCVAKLIREKTRMETGSISREDISLGHLKYLDVLKL